MPIVTSETAHDAGSTADPLPYRRSQRWSSPAQLAVKRALDVIGAGFGLLFLLPLYVGIALAIWLANGRPILYRWMVVGLNGRPILSWKFRTMIPDADRHKSALLRFNEMQGPVFKMRNDPRITRIGRFLRRHSLDELPQLWSVLRGDFSLVGPRPPLVEEYERFEPWQKYKLSVKPGLTCLWQVSGRNEIAAFDEWLRLDLEYIANWSLLLDVKIILRTIFSVVSGKGAS